MGIIATTIHVATCDLCSESIILEKEAYYAVSDYGLALHVHCMTQGHRDMYNLMGSDNAYLHNGDDYPVRVRKL